MSAPSDRPAVRPGQWIRVGDSIAGRNAVVCGVHDAHIEVVYYDDKRQPINEDVVWNGSWQFKHAGPCGGYAAHNSRLSEYVAILRRGPAV